MDLPEGHLPAPPSERGAWLIAIVLAVLGALVLGLIWSGVVGRTDSSGPLPPPVLAVTPTPVPVPTSPVSDVIARGSRPSLSGAVLERSVARTGQPGAGLGRPARHAGASIVGKPTSAQQRRDLAAYELQSTVHISNRWMQGFYPIYAQAQRVFGVNWLLIASIHRQESAFSTDPTTYKGLNFAGCCGGPMQFNVTNGPVTTWALVSNSYRYGQRPASYDHMAAKHPSIYDDFDAIMAAAHLLSADGAGLSLDSSAWAAAYDYYGHDLTGVTYADQVLARAIGWSQHGFCVNCGVPTSLIEAVHGAYGAQVAAGFAKPAVAAPAKRAGRRR
jgi:hypothetical protein